MGQKGGAIFSSAERNLLASLLLRLLLPSSSDLIGRVRSPSFVWTMLLRMCSGVKGQVWGHSCPPTHLNLLASLLLWLSLFLCSGLIGRVRSCSLVWTMALETRSGVEGPSCGAFFLPLLPV
mgnify:FL=1